jgi:pyrroline-5-carboxylate reductase
VKATVFLGGGRITSALIAGLRLARYPAPILVHDHHPEKLRELKRRYGVAVERDLGRAVASAGLLLIAVRPLSVRELLSRIGKVPHAVIVVSLAAGIPLRHLRRYLGAKVRWVRAMPSPVCRVGRGLTGVTFPASASARTKKSVKDFFSKVGSVLEIPEAQFDAFTVTYSSSHGYHALAALAEAAGKLGLNRRHARAAAAHALADGVVAWREANIRLQALLHEAATPGGVAATVMEAMDQAGYRKAVERGLRAGLVRAKANARKSGPTRA